MFARVAVARPLGDELTYAIPAPLGELRVGHVVLVPLGSQGETGYVVGTSDEPGLRPGADQAGVAPAGPAAGLRRRTSWRSSG